MAGCSVVRVAGPLALYASGFDRELSGRGYVCVSAEAQLRLMAHVSRWLGGEGLDAAAFTPERVEAFCAARRRAGYSGLRTAKALRPLREFLQQQGVLAPPAPSSPASGQELLLARYRSYLVHERGLVEPGVAAYARTAGLFLAAHPGLLGAGAAVDAAAVTAFCTLELPRRSGSGAKNLAAGLRSFLRFLHVAGVVDAPLARSVPAVASRKGAGLPRALPPAIARRLLSSCDRRTRIGRRDYAIMLLLLRLGLRAGEVARLTLDDIDWQVGEVLVRGKGDRQERLPIPADVGAALAGYLHRGRPRSQSRAVFLRAIAPAMPLTPTGMTWVVYAACDRAGVSRVGAHRLRHTAATEMLRAGASLTEVGQALRHAAVATTAIYAKVDDAALRPLAPSWPGRAS